MFPQTHITTTITALVSGTVLQGMTRFLRAPSLPLPAYSLLGSSNTAVLSLGCTIRTRILRIPNLHPKH